MPIITLEHIQELQNQLNGGSNSTPMSNPTPMNNPTPPTNEAISLERVNQLYAQMNNKSSISNNNGVGATPAPKATKKSVNTGKGNIDLDNRPQFKHADGSVSTVRSMSFNENGKEILIPTIDTDKHGNPRQLSDQAAIDRYHRTGEYLGKFDTVEEANKYAKELHKSQAKKYSTTDSKQRVYKHKEDGKIDMLSDKAKAYSDEKKMYEERQNTLLNPADYATESLSSTNPKATVITDENAKEILDKEDYKDRKKKQASINQTSEWASKHPIAATGIKVLSSPIAGVEGVVNNAYGLATGNPTDNKILKNYNNLATGVKSNMNSNVGEGAYDFGTGIAEFALEAAMGKGVLGLTTGGKFAGEEQEEALSRGMSERQASALGLGAGTLEGVMNTIGFNAVQDKFTKTGVKTLADVARNAGVAGLANGAENFAQFTGNEILDSLIGGENSRFNTDMAEGIANGMTEDEAREYANKNMQRRIFGQTALGFGMGAVMGGSSQLANLGLQKVARNASDKVQANGMLELAKNTDEPTKVSEPVEPRYLDPVDKELNDPAFIETHTPEETANAVDYVNSTDPNLLQAIKDARNGKKIEYELVSTPQMADEIKRLTGKDVDKALLILDNSSVAHTDKDHGAKGLSDNSMADDNTLSRIQYILNNFDEAFEGKGSKEHKNSDGTYGKTVAFVKKIDGHYVVVEATPQNKKNNNFVVGAHIVNGDGLEEEIKKGNLKRVASATNESSSLRTSEIGHAVSSNSTIVPSETNVNTNKVMAEDYGIPKNDTTTEITLPTMEKVVNNPRNIVPEENVSVSTRDGSEVLTSEPIKERRTSENIRLGKEKFSASIAEELEKNPEYYITKSNAEADRVSDEIMKQGTTYSRNMFEELSNRRNPVAIPLARKLANQYVADGDIDSAMYVTRKLAEDNTVSAQWLQANAINMLKGNPAALVDYIKSDIAKINEQGKQQFGNKWKDFELTDEELRAFETMAKNGSVDEAETKRILDNLGKRIEAEYPVKVKDVFVEAGHIGMLLNMSTMERNVMANVFMLPQKALAQRYTALGQDAYNFFNRKKGKSVDKNEYFGISGRKTKKLARRAWDEKGKGSIDDSQKYFDDRLTQLYGNNSLKESISQRAYFKLHNDNALSRGWDNLKTAVGLDANKNMVANVYDNIPVLNKVNPKNGLNTLAKIVADPSKAFEDVNVLRKTAGENLSTLSKNLSGMENKFDNLSAEKSIMENVRQFTYDLLDIGDEPFVRINFVNRLASYMDAKGIKNYEDIPDEAIEIAKQEALKATFKDDNEFTKTFGKLAKIPVAGEVAIPFKKTTANLAARAYDYSLANILYTSSKELSKGNSADFNKVIKALGEGASGTTFVALGALLYRNGIITGPNSSDADQKKFDEANGKKPYALSYKGLSDFINKHLGTNIDLGNEYKTWDWAQPWSANFATGIAMIDAAMNDEDKSLFDIGMDVIAAYGDGILESDLMTNIKEMLGAGDFSDESTTMNVINSLVEFPTRYIPSQVKAMAKTRDNVKRETYVKDDKVATTLNTIKSGIPVLREQLPKSYNIYGDEIKLSGDSKQERRKANYFSAGKTGVDQSKWYSDNIQDLYDKTGDIDVFPHQERSFTYTDEDGNKINKQLTPKEYSDMTKAQGELVNEFSDYYFKSFAYENTDDDINAKVYKHLNKLATDIAKNEVFGVPMSKTTQEIYDIYNEDGVEGVVEYYTDYEANEKRNKGIRDLGLEVNDVTKEMYENGDEEGLDKYTSATEIAKEYDRDGITKEQWNIYDKKGVKEFRKELTYDKAAKDNDVSDTKAFREAYDNHKVNSYVKAYKAITSTESGVDEYGEPKYLSYTDTTRAVYDEGGARALKEYVEASQLLEKLNMEKKDMTIMVKHDNIEFARNHNENTVRALADVENGGSKQAEWLPVLKSKRLNTNDAYDIIMTMIGGEDKLPKDCQGLSKQQIVQFYYNRQFDKDGNVIKSKKGSKSTSKKMEVPHYQKKTVPTLNKKKK